MSTARVVLTLRGWGVVAGGLLTILLGDVALNPLVILLGVLFVALPGVELAVFAWATRDLRPESFTTQRSENTSQLTVDGLGSMALRLERRPGPGYYLEVYDRQPEGLRTVGGSPRLLTWWAGGGAKQLAYAYRAERRGAFEIGPVIAVAHDPLGLAFRVAQIESRWPVEAIPRAAYWSADIASRIRAEPLGRVLSDRRGAGSEFRSLREYDPSDDFRSIVWKRSTLDRLFVRESESENRNEVALLVDVSRAMGVGLPGGDALDQAVDAALLIARYAFGQGDRVALLLHGAGPVRFLPLDLRLDHSVQIDRALASARCLPGRFRMDAALQYLTEHLGRPSAIFAFTAVAPSAGIPEPVYRSLRSAGHRLYVFTPDPLAQYPSLGSEFEDEIVAFTAAPDASRSRTAMEALRALGVSVTTYDRTNLPDLVARRYARLRGGAEGG